MLPYEKETIISHTAWESTTGVYTFDEDMVRRLDKLADEHPDDVRLVCRNDRRGMVEYDVPKDWFSVRPKEPGGVKSTECRICSPG